MSDDIRLVRGYRLGLRPSPLHESHSGFPYIATAWPAGAPIRFEDAGKMWVTRNGTQVRILCGTEQHGEFFAYVRAQQDGVCWEVRMNKLTLPHDASKPERRTEQRRKDARRVYDRTLSESYADRACRGLDRRSSRRRKEDRADG